MMLEKNNPNSTYKMLNFQYLLWVCWMKWRSFLQYIYVLWYYASIKNRKQIYMWWNETTSRIYYIVNKMSYSTMCTVCHHPYVCVSVCVSVCMHAPHMCDCVVKEFLGKVARRLVPCCLWEKLMHWATGEEGQLPLCNIFLFCSNLFCLFKKKQGILHLFCFKDCFRDKSSKAGQSESMKHLLDLLNKHAFILFYFFTGAAESIEYKPELGDNHLFTRNGKTAW